MNYSIRVAKEEDIQDLLSVRNNMDLFSKYLKQQNHKEVYFVVAEGDNALLGFGLLKLNGSSSPKLSDL